MIITKWALLNFDPKYRYYLVRTVHRKMGVGMSAHHRRGVGVLMEAVNLTAIYKFQKPGILDKVERQKFIKPMNDWPLNINKTVSFLTRR